MIRLIDERIMEKLRDKPENIDLEEFVPLVVEWREEKALMANCPYCVKPIEKQATKCNHCLSELEWFKFDGLYGPCKAGASEEMEAALVMARATIQAAVEAEKAAAEEKIKAAKEKIKLADKLAELSKSRCISCNKLVFTSDELEVKTMRAAVDLANNRCYSPIDDYSCVSCTITRNRKVDAIGIIVFITIILLVFLAIWSGIR